jgi:hypothetical protein
MFEPLYGLCYGLGQPAYIMAEERAATVLEQESRQCNTLGANWPRSDQ